MSLPIELLRKHWQHDFFREPQEEIIEAVLTKQDTFVLLPTGGGKSICFQIPALVMPGVCIVISPLVALMEDQVNNLNKINIKATAIIGGTSLEEIDAIIDNCTYGNYKFLYLSPERLTQTWLMERIEKLNINLIAIDEAHCISQWGYDFRPSYLEISKLRDLLPQVPMIALTASATERVIEDICTNLQLKKPKIFKKSFYRSNLIYGVYHIENKFSTIERILQKNPLPTIIYARNRKETQSYAKWLNERNYKALYFHGGLSSFEKKKRLQEWIEEKTPIIVATNAFGMGIDKKNVKNVIHIQIPENLENYYQEAGRAGRDNNKAFASILVNKKDIESIKEWQEKNLFDKDFLKLVYRKLNNFLNIAYGEGYNMTYSLQFNKFCSHNKFPYIKAYNALQFLDRQGIIKLAQNSNNKTKLLFTALSGDLLDIVYDDERAENVLLFILRNYNGIHEYETDINLEFISEHTEESVEYIEKCITYWQEQELCQYIPEDNDISITFNEVWEEDRALYRTFSFLNQQNNLKTEQYKSMLFYIENNDICKNKILLRYFDEKLEEDCGNCSICIEKKRKAPGLDFTKYNQLILTYLKNAPQTLSDLSVQIQLGEQETMVCLQLLLEDNTITMNYKNQYLLK
ncbi:MAG: RecQ family ATP-dependent DNA helicase [Flavobacteriaceae bacterium]|jgi:ATP-dependent DNA helicase RecQ|nr:RecQ family ATP-dependent DNA helicase [Flavobacteriaceae bacterium]